MNKLVLQYVLKHFILDNVPSLLWTTHLRCTIIKTSESVHLATLELKESNVGESELQNYMFSAIFDNVSNITGLSLVSCLWPQFYFKLCIFFYYKFSKTASFLFLLVPVFCSGLSRQVSLVPFLQTSLLPTHWILLLKTNTLLIVKSCDFIVFLRFSALLYFISWLLSWLIYKPYLPSSPINLLLTSSSYF